MIDFLSVVISTLNPDISRLNRTLEGLKNQTLPVHNWELIIVDNNSSKPIPVDLSWNPNNKIVIEPKPGLTFGRLKGFQEAKGDLIILVDDDNILEESYLSRSLNIFREYPGMGAVGGKTIPDFELPPPDWLKEFYGNLALRDLGDDIIINKWDEKYPAASPIGAGMVARKKAIESYIIKINNRENPITDRQGKSLSSGGDNDMVLEILKAGWQVAYFPTLCLKHIIPKERMQVEYLARLNNNTNKSWVMLLENHHINPWSKISGWSVPLRKIKAWFTYKPWRSKINFIKWQGACGAFDGLSKKNYPS